MSVRDVLAENCRPSLRQNELGRWAADAAFLSPTSSPEHSKAQVREARARGEVELLHLVAADRQRPKADVGDAVAPADVELA